MQLVNRKKVQRHVIKKYCVSTNIIIRYYERYIISGRQFCFIGNYVEHIQTSLFRLTLMPLDIILDVSYWIHLSLLNQTYQTTR